MNHTAFVRHLFTLLFLSSTIIYSQSWKEFKSFEGTTTNCVAYHPSGRLFLSTMEFGIFVSDDDGKNWVNSLPNSSPIRFDYYQHIVFDAYDNVYVNSTDRKEILFSSDRGTSWIAKPIPGPSGNFVHKLAADTRGNIYAGTKGKIYKSDDFGTSWKLIYDHGSNLMIQQIEFYYGTIFATLDQIGMVISYDFGKTWKYKWLPQSNYRAMAVLNEKEFFVSCFMELPLPSVYNGVLYTEDGGDTWLEVNSDISSLYFTSMKTLNDGSVLAGADYGKVYKTTNKGMSWELLSAGTMATEVNSITFKDDKIFCGSFYSGVIKSANYGKTWDFSNKGLGKVRTFSIQNLSDGNYFVANSAGTFLYDSKNQKYIPRSLYYNTPIPTKKELNQGSQPRDIKVYNDKEVYYSSYSGGVFHSTDLGITWKRINTNTNSSGVNWIIKTDNNSLLYESLFNTQGLYQKVNNSEWKLINNTLHNLAEPVKDGLNNYYTTDMFNIYKSTDNCTSWKMLSNLQYYLGMGYYINTDNSIYATTTNGLYNSKDGGETWSLIKKPLPYPLGNKTTEQIAVISKDQVLCATDAGVYKSSDGGLNWELSRDELWGKRVLKFQKANDGSLFAVLEHSIYKYEQTTDVEKNELLPFEFMLMQNYPNPFNPETTIKYSIPRNEFVTLKVFDMLGREVNTLVNEHKQAGNYSVQFNGKGLSSGVYIYQIKAGNYSDVKKFTLIK